MRAFFLSITVCILVVVPGCSEDEETPSPPTLAEMRACAVDTDCIAVLSVCCGCGAELDDFTGINADYEAAYSASIGCEPDMTCDGCIGPTDQVERRATCEVGVCEGGAVPCTGANDCGPGNSCPVGSTLPPSPVCMIWCNSDDECRDGEVCGSAGQCTTG